MKFTILSATAALLAMALAKSSSTTNPAPDAAAMISSYYPTSTPSFSNSAQMTSLASALYSVNHPFTDSPQYTSMVSAIYAATPSAAQASISKSGFLYNDVVTNSWYSTGVPDSAKKVLTSEWCVG